MWKMLFFLWLVPIALALLGIKRVADGRRVVTAKELRLVIGDAKLEKLSPWFWLALFVMALGFFALGVVQAVVLLNANVFLAAAAPLLTVGLLTLLLILLMRNRFSYRRAARGTRERDPREAMTYSPDF